MPRDEYLSREDLADRLGVDVRTVTNWVKNQRGFPSRMRGKERDFPWLRCLQWHIEREIAKSAPAPAMDEKAARARKMAAEATEAELDLRERQNELMPVAVHVERFERLASHFAAIGRGGLTKFIGDIQRVDNPVDAQLLLDRMGDELMDSWRALDEDIGDLGLGDDESPYAAD
jgi:transcriptional regulator with XRE-family HTH domain